MEKQKPVLIQCDFDGTITNEDASFTILNKYLPDTWEDMFDQYQAGNMTLGEFNTRAFSMVNADRKTLLQLVDESVTVREGFSDFMTYCRDRDFRFVIVSNGLDFYIEHILLKAGFPDIEIHASITEFKTDHLEVRHKGPDGNYLDNDVKAAFTGSFLAAGYDVIYLGDGKSDVLPASKSGIVFATGSLVRYCREQKLDCTPFDSFNQVIQTMESSR